MNPQKAADINLNTIYRCIGANYNALAHESCDDDCKKLSSRTKSIIRKRGRTCFFCGQIITNPRISLEHLQAKANGGAGMKDNTYPAHKKCNSIAGDLPVKEKLKLRETMTYYANIIVKKKSSRL